MYYISVKYKRNFTTYTNVGFITQIINLMKLYY